MRAAAERVIVIPTKTMRPEEFAEQIRKLVEARWVRPPAAQEEILSLESRLGITLPDDLRSFYTCIGGTDEPTPLENGWMTFWPLDRWETPVGEAKLFGHRLTLIADHAINSWWYAAEISARPETPIFIVDGLRPPRPIAVSFADFVALALRNESSIYAEPLERGAG